MRLNLIAAGAASGVTPEILTLALWMVPAVLAGYLASRFVNRFLNAARLRLLALGASALGSLLLTGQLAVAAL